MYRKNKFIFRSKLSEAQFLRLLDFFCADFNASEISQFIGLSRNTVNKIVAALRVRIHRMAVFEGIDHFSDTEYLMERFSCQEGLRATPTLGVQFSKEKVRTVFFPSFPLDLFNALFDRDLKPTCPTFPHDLKSFGLLAELQGKKRHLDLRTEGALSPLANRPKETARFHSFLKMRMSKFRGAKEETLPYHCKETELRYNYRFENLFSKLARELAENPLKIKESLEVYGTPYENAV